MAAEKEQRKEKTEKKGGHREQKEQTEAARPPEKRLLNVVRLGETNLDGNRKVSSALLGIDGISFSMSRIIADISKLGEKKVSELSDEEIHKLEDIINHPDKHHIPSWMYNRRKGPEKGETVHLTTSQLEFSQKMDIDRMKKTRTYKGVRHMLGQPVRGQRTRSSFRTGGTVGVQRKAAKAARAATSKGEK